MDTWGDVRKRHIKERETAAYSIRDKWAEMVFYAEGDCGVPDRWEDDFDKFMFRTISELETRQLDEVAPYKECDISQYKADLQAFGATFSAIKKSS